MDRFSPIEAAEQCPREQAGQALPHWRTLLQAARQREGDAPQARWLQLASLGRDGAPRVRTLVFRAWVGPDRLDLLTDSRSKKASELSAEPRLELCWLLPHSRCQFRMRGQRLQLPYGEEKAARVLQWQQLKATERALWAWPEPGAPLDARAHFPAEVAETTPIPTCFVLLRIQLKQVELLELTGMPHKRRLWCADQNWKEERLNP